MDAIFSIRKPFTDMIFCEEKDLEFRNKIGKELFPGSKIYIYETKRNSGAGAVIGSVIIESIEGLPYHKTGTYNLLSYFTEKYGTEEEKETVRKAMRIRLTQYDESVVLCHLFDDKMLDYMFENDKVPDVFKFPPFYGHSIDEFNKIKEKGRDLICRCDSWLTRIGYYTETDDAPWKYMIKVKESERFLYSKSITEFIKRDGTALTRAPQSWCYTLGKQKERNEDRNETSIMDTKIIG